MIDSNPESNLSVAKNSVRIMIAQGMGLIAGLAFDVLAALTFGASLKMDAYFVAVALPQLLSSVMVSSGIRVLSPVFTQTAQKGKLEHQHRVLSASLNWSLSLLLSLVVLGWAAAEGLIRLQSPGLADAGRPIAVQAFRLAILNIALIGAVEVFRAYLVFQRRFFLATLANFIRFGIGVLVLFSLRGTLDILAMPWAYLAGGAVQFVVYAAAYLTSGGKYYPTFGRDLGVPQMLRSRLGPPTLAELIGQSNVLVERFFASFLPPGVLSVLGYGRRILVALNHLMTSSIATAILPRISEEAQGGELQKLRQSILFGTRLVGLITGAASVLVIGLSGPLSNLLLLRGAFDQPAAELTARVVQVYAPSILLMGLIQLLAVPFYAIGETQIILRLRSLFLVFHAAACAFLYLPLGGPGLAAAFTLSQVFTTVLWLRALHRRLDGLGRRFGSFLGRLIILLSLVSIGLVVIGAFIGAVANPILIVAYSAAAGLLALAVLFGLSLGLGLMDRSGLQEAYLALSARMPTR